MNNNIYNRIAIDTTSLDAPTPTDKLGIGAEAAAFALGKLRPDLNAATIAQRREELQQIMPAELLPQEGIQISLQASAMVDMKSLSERSPKGAIHSIDVPYAESYSQVIKDTARMIRRDHSDPGLTHAAMHLAYATTQATSLTKGRALTNQRELVHEAAIFIEDQTVRLRVCTEFFVNDEYRVNLQRIITSLQHQGRRVRLLVEPNPKYHENVAEFLNFIEQIQEDFPGGRDSIRISFDVTHIAELIEKDRGWENPQGILRGLKADILNDTTSERMWPAAIEYAGYQFESLPNGQKVIRTHQPLLHTEIKLEELGWLLYGQENPKIPKPDIIIETRPDDFKLLKAQLPIFLKRLNHP